MGVPAAVGSNSGAKCTPQVSAQKPAAPAVKAEAVVAKKLQVKEQASKFDPAAFQRTANQNKVSCGRGTNDDSIGRGTNDDSIGGGKGCARNIAGDETCGGSLDRFVLARLTSRLTPAGQGAVQGLLSGSEATRKATAHLVSSPRFQAEPPAFQERVLTLAAKTGEVGTKALAKMMDLPEHVLCQQDSKGQTLLTNLEKMGQSRDKDVRRALAATMADVANPARIWQGDSPTCTVTTMQFEVAKHAPAEYARLIGGLALDGKVTMMGGGVLERTNTDFSKQALKGQRRTITEAAFQDAAMEYANGKEKYDTRLQESVREDGTTHRGLKGEMIREMAVQLSSAKYERYDIPNDETASGVADVLAGKSTVKVTSPVLIDLDMGQFNHCVAFEKIDDGKVFFRDPETGAREQMSLEEFNKRAVAAYGVVE